MTTADRPRVVSTTTTEHVVWNSPERGYLSFATLIGDGAAATSQLGAGVAVLAPGGWLATHRHRPAEVYVVTAGTGIVTVDGADHPVGPGSAVFVPSRAEHGILNVGEDDLVFTYVFAADRFDDVVYEFSPRSAALAVPA